MRKCEYIVTELSNNICVILHAYELLHIIIMYRYVQLLFHRLKMGIDILIMIL
jgi:hypothetical protein